MAPLAPIAIAATAAAAVVSAAGSAQAAAAAKATGEANKLGYERAAKVVEQQKLRFVSRIVEQSFYIINFFCIIYFSHVSSDGI